MVIDLESVLLRQGGYWFNFVDWSATGAVIGGLSTMVIALLTYVLIKENRLLRKAGNSPRVVAHFEFHPDGLGGLNLALSNVGTGPAFDVSFLFEKDDADFENYQILVDYTQERSAMTMIGQGEKISFLFAAGYQLFKPKDHSISERLKPFKVIVSWNASDSSKRFLEMYQLDVSAYAGLPGLMNKSPLLKIVDELAEINTQLSSRAGVPARLLDATTPEQCRRSVAKGADDVRD